MNDEQYIGYLKYEGALVKDGLLDARKAAQALLGFDEAVRFFVGQCAPQLRDVDFDLPVRIRKGSWEALIPTTLIDWLVTAFGAGLTMYFVTAGRKFAEKDFEKIGLQDIFVHAIESIQWMIRIGKHLGDLLKKRFEGAKFRNQNTEIGIPNGAGEYLFVPKRYFDFYVAASPRLLRKIATLVEDERRMEIGVHKDGSWVRETLLVEHKAIFTFDDEGDEILFPELQHDQQVTLEGHITRGNENTNSLGLRYQEHILGCYPETGSIVSHKESLFLNCRVHGIISRLDKFGGHNETKPKIIFSRIEPIERSAESLSLFDDI